MSDHTYDLVLSEAMLREFYEIEKRAGISGLLTAGAGQAARTGLSAGAGRFLGAGIGAVGGGLLGRSQAPEGTEGVGTVRGALLGAGAGLLGGQFATGAGRTQALRFGQRQLHGATGYLPGRGLFGAVGPKLEGADRIKALEEIGFKFRPGTKGEIIKATEKEVGEGRFSRLLPKKVKKFWAGRKASAELARKQLAEEGMTSVPGLVRGYFAGGTSGKLSPLEAAKLNLVAPGAAMGVGIPAALSAASINEYRKSGDTRRLASDLAGNATFALGGGVLPIGAVMGLSTAGSAGGGLIGRGVDFLRGRQVPPAPVGQVVPR